MSGDDISVGLLIIIASYFVYTGYYWWTEREERGKAIAEEKKQHVAYVKWIDSLCAKRFHAPFIDGKDYDSPLDKEEHKLK